VSTRALQFITYAEYLQTDHWRQVRAETLRLAGYKCILCGHSDRPLQAHHTDQGYQYLGEEIPGVHTRCLCAQCHEELSVGREVLQGTPAIADVCKTGQGGAFAKK